MERRASGDARGADVIGWLTLAAIMAGGRLGLLTRLVRSVGADEMLSSIVGDTGDGLGKIAEIDAAPVDVEVVGLTVPDMGSRAGWALADFTGSAAGAVTVTLNGFPLPSATVLGRISQRIAAAERGVR